MKKAYDIFGIETDVSIQKRADEEKQKAYKKRLEIIDGDILTYLHNYKMLDEMATQPTKLTKKEYIVNYLLNDIPRIRKGPDSYGKQDFAYKEEYKNKPVEKEMCEKMANYILSYYAHEDGVKYQRKNLSSDSYIIVDKNGINVCAARYDNSDLVSEYKEKFIRQKYPREKPENKKYYSSNGESIWTHLLTDEEKIEATKMAKKDKRYIKFIEVD